MKPLMTLATALALAPAAPALAVAQNNSDFLQGEAVPPPRRDPYPGN